MLYGILGVGDPRFWKHSLPPPPRLIKKITKTLAVPSYCHSLLLPPTLNGPRSKWDTDKLAPAATHAQTENPVVPAAEAATLQPVMGTEDESEEARVCA